MKKGRLPRILGRLAVTCAFALGLLAAGGCDKTAACRPGTLFVELTLDPAAETADQLHIVVVTDTRHETTVAYSGGKSIQISFPNDVYPAGSSADVTIEALRAGVVVAKVTKSGFVLPKSCGALALSFADGSGGDGGAGDGGIDQAVPDLPEGDLAGADLVPSNDDLTGADFAGSTDDLASSLLANGATCGAAAECASNFCVDGVCCDVACDGQCEACDNAGSVGTCGGVDGAPHGGRTACGGADVCAGACVATTPKACTFPGGAVTCRAESCADAVKTLAASCDGAGACPAVSTFSCPSAACNGTNCLGACTTNGDCGGSTPYCNLPEGVCKATKDEGETCTAGNQCTSTFCVDGFCCDGACNGQCQACNVTTGGNKAGQCTKVSAGQPVSNAVTTRTACAGSGTCKGSCDGTSPTACGFPGTGVDCGTSCACTNGSTNCTCSSSCASAKKQPRACNGAGACTDGTPVTCTNNICNGGATDCGTCTMDAECGAGRYCDGTACRLKKANGGSCSTTNGDHECTNGHCVSGICCASACGGTTPACKANGSGCACTGTSCTGGLSCFNDVCCDDSCPSCQTSTSTNACGHMCNTVCAKSCVGGVCCSTNCPTCRLTDTVKNECGQLCNPHNCTTNCDTGSCCVRNNEQSCHTSNQPDGCGSSYPPNCTGTNPFCNSQCGCMTQGDTCCQNPGGDFIICSGAQGSCNGTGGCCGGGVPCD